ncbi:MAG: hypothetical protein VB078_00120 [Clostridiaceae bacterium]|nr:hypothetical protein [Clostridiaceae bacterium]DAM37316.1 MAG TPA: tail protein [Caudoviricetes sp.]
MKLIYEGTDIWADVSVNRIIHDMYAEKHADTLTIRLNDTRKLWDGWTPAPDDTIAVEDGAAKSGTMYVDGMTPENGLYVIRATSTPQTMKVKNTKSWEKVKLTQLAQEIAARHGLTLSTYGITDRLYEYVAQENLADLAFLQQRCTLEGAAFLVYDGKLVLYDEAYMESRTPSKTLKIPNNGSFEFVDNAAKGYGSVTVNNGGFTGTFSAGNGLSKELVRVLNVQIGSQDEADRFAKGILRDANKDATTGTFWTSGLLREYAAGSVVDITTEGASSWDGAGFISAMRHDYTKKSTKVTIRKPLEGY